MRANTGPDLLAAYPGTPGKSYFADLAGNGAPSRQMVNFYNHLDAGMDAWNLSQDTKPNGDWIWMRKDGQDQYWRTPLLAGPTRLEWKNGRDRYEIFAHIVASRSWAAGETLINGPGICAVEMSDMDLEN